MNIIEFIVGFFWLSLMGMIYEVRDEMVYDVLDIEEVLRRGEYVVICSFIWVLEVSI